MARSDAPTPLPSELSWGQRLDHARSAIEHLLPSDVKGQLQADIEQLDVLLIGEKQRRDSKTSHILNTKQISQRYLESISTRTPAPFRRALYLGAKLAWWMVTPHLSADRYRHYRQLSASSKPPVPKSTVSQPFVDTVETPIKPRILFVISTQSGGIPQTNIDLMRAFADRYEPYLLRCDSTNIELSKLDHLVLTRLEKISLRKPITAFPHTSQEYDGTLRRMLAQYAIALVHIRHIGWHSLGLPGVCHSLGIPVLFSFHDFYTICPTVKLLDENLRFCAGKCTATLGRCEPELWPRETMPPLKHDAVYDWQAAMKAMLEDCDGYITTSQGARDQISAIFPGTLAKPFVIIPHGRDLEMRKLSGWPSEKDPRIRILLPGNIVPAKGSYIVESLAELDVERLFEFHVLGYSSLPKNERFVLHGPYGRDDFADKVSQIRPHLGAIFSIWPETFCHTLTEMWACGVPVVALDSGAVGERIRETGSGWLVTGRNDPASIYRQLLAILGNKDDYLEKMKSVISWQLGVGTNQTTRAMSYSYERVYRDVLAANERSNV